MTRLQLTGLALAAACAIAATPAAHAQFAPPPVPMAPAPPPPAMVTGEVDSLSGTPVFTPGDEGGPMAAERNVVESDRYEALLRSNPGFRKSRIRQECGTFNDPSTYSWCVDSFGGGNAEIEH